MTKYKQRFDSEPADLDEETWTKVIDIVRSQTTGERRFKKIITFNETVKKGDDYECTGKYIRWYDNGKRVRRIGPDIEFKGERQMDKNSPFMAFYKIANMWFSFQGEDKLRLSISSGPLCGNGSLYDYVVDENGHVKWFNGHELWVS